MGLLQSKLFAAILGALMFLLTTAFLIPQGVGKIEPKEGDAAVDPVRPAQTRGPSWNFFNPEMDQIIAELKMEKETMAAKEKALSDLETRLKADRAELDEATKRITKIQDQVNRDMFRIKDDEAANLKKLGKMYTSMEPASAAKILKELDDAVVVKILTLMKDADSGVILDAFSRLGEPETKRAAKISENLRLAIAQKTAPKP